MILFVVISLVLIAIAAASRAQRLGDPNDFHLAGRELGGVAAGLSGAITGNSGFIMTGAVGMGYLMGWQALLLPVAWFIGDLIFWNIMAERLREESWTHDSKTLPSLVFSGESPEQRVSKATMALLLLLPMAAYLSAQWLSAGKVIGPALGLDYAWATFLVAAVVTTYTALGGFRASVWTDVAQSVLVVLFVLGLLVLSFFHSERHAGGVSSAISATPSVALIAPEPAAFVVFILGWILAAVSFGLSQPQVATRIMATRASNEVHVAKWVYIVVLQATWVGMTFIGILAKGILTESSDPEAAGFQVATIVLGSLGAAGFATVAGLVIATTADSLLVAVSSMISVDLMSSSSTRRSQPVALAAITGLSTAMVAAYMTDSVYQIALGSVVATSTVFGPLIVVKLVLPSAISMARLALAVLIVTAILAGYLQFVLKVEVLYQAAACSLPALMLVFVALRRRKTISRA